MPNIIRNTQAQPPRQRSCGPVEHNISAIGNKWLTTELGILGIHVASLRPLFLRETKTNYKVLFSDIIYTVARREHYHSSVG